MVHREHMADEAELGHEIEGAHGYGRLPQAILEAALSPRGPKLLEDRTID